MSILTCYCTSLGTTFSNHKRQQHPLIIFRITSHLKMSMEDLLQDPKTTWKEIRSAMSQGRRHSTNGGIVMAVVTASEVSLSQERGKEEHNLEDNKEASEDDDTKASSHDSQFDENLLSNHDTLAPVNFGYNPCNTRTSAKNNPRRGTTSEAERDRAAFNSSFTSINAYSINSSITSALSVDMMDFGVDHDAAFYSMEALNEIESKRGTPCSITNEEECSSCLTNGFLDWNHDDESSCSAYASQHIDRDKSCPSHKPASHESLEHPPAPEVRRRESWHIEDHDFEPVTNHCVFPKMVKRLSSGTYDTFSSLFTKLTLELGPGMSLSFPHDDRCEPQAQEATTDEVKRALSFSISRAKYHFDDIDSRRASC